MSQLYRIAFFACLCIPLATPAARAADWDGDGSQGNFSWWNNWYGDNLDNQVFNSSTPLYFQFNNSGQTTLNQDIGYRSVQSIIYQSTFTGDTTLQGNDGFDLYWKVENLDTGHHTINVPLIVQGAALELNPINGNLTVGGGINNFQNRDLLVYGDNGHTLTLNSTFSGTGAGLTLHGDSLVVLNGEQTYTGTTTINSGEIRLGAANRISDSSALAVNSGGTMNLNNFNETVASLSLASGGTLSLGTGQLIVNGGSGTWAGSITSGASGSLVKKGSGTVSVTGNNTGLAGAWYVVGGIVGFNHNNAAGSGTVYLGETGGSDAATIDISSTGVNVGNDIVVRSGSSGSKTIDQAVGSGTATFSGNITLNDTLRVTSSSGETLVLSGNISGSNKLVKDQAGTVTLSGSNSYSGNTEIDRGTLSVSGSLNSGSHVYLGNGLNGDAATLALSGSGTTMNNLTVNPSSGSGSRSVSHTAGSHSVGTLTLNRDATVSSSGGSLAIGALAMGNNDLTINNSVGVQITGAISASSGAADLNKQGSGTLTISGNNSSSYKLNITQGTVYLNHANALGTAYSDKVNFAGSSSELRIGADISPASLGMTINNVTATLNVDNARTFTVAGQIQGAGGTPNVVKSGLGTLEVDGIATYSGSTAVNAGTLRVGSSGSLASSSLTSVNSGGTLAGLGTVGALAVNSGGLLSPGNSPGTLSAGNTSWNGGGGYLWEINDVDAGAGADPGWDLLDVTGTLTIGATDVNPFTIYVTSLTLGNVSGSVHDFNTLTSYQWLIATASGGVSGFSTDKFTLNTSSFSNPNSGLWSVSNVGNNVYLNYTGGEAFAAVPEPSTLGLIAAAGALLAGLRRRIRRSTFALAGV